MPSTTRLLLVTVPEWGHLSPFLHMAASIERNWDSSKGTLQLTLASMEQVRPKVEARGIDFLSIGEWSQEEAKEYARSVMASFDPTVGFFEKLNHGSDSIMQMLGLKMGSELIKHLEAAKAASTLPSVIVTDGLTSAGFDAAEMFDLPLAVIWPFPLSMALMLAGYPNYNLPSDVPVEFLNFNTHEKANPIIRKLINPVFKRGLYTIMNALFGRTRQRVRQGLGMPAALAPPMLRAADGTSSGVQNSWGGPMAVQPSVPRAIYVAGVAWEMNAKRELPPNWHMVGPLVVDRQSDFPPQFGAEDAAVKAFLDAAADAGEPVVFTAAGSMTHLTQQQVDALLDTFNTLTSSNSNSSSSQGRIRILWALREDSQHLLPAHLRSSSSSSKQAPISDLDAAAAADYTHDSSSRDRILVASWVKQTAVLAHPATKIFITHGGLGSVHECLALGKAVPLVVPFSNGADHCTIGQQLESRGLGMLLKPSELLRPGRLTTAVEGLLGDEECSRRVAGVAQAWEQAGFGPKMAAELLIQFANGKEASKC